MSATTQQTTQSTNLHQRFPLIIGEWGGKGGHQFRFSVRNFAKGDDKEEYRLYYNEKGGRSCICHLLPKRKLRYCKGHEGFGSLHPNHPSSDKRAKFWASICTCCRRRSCFGYAHSCDCCQHEHCRCCKMPCECHYCME